MVTLMSARTATVVGLPLDTEDDEYEVEPEDVRSDNAVGSGVTPTLQLCSAHKPGQMVEVCKTCAAALSMVRPEVAKQLIAPVPVTALARYSARSDEKPPSLLLPSGIIELAENIFNAGMFRGRSHWNELVQKFLCLPPDQHNRLVKDLQPEQMFRKMESESRFKYIFQFRKDLGDCLKNLRISQRIIFSMVDTIDTHIPVLRGLGMAAGLAYPPVAPTRSNPSVPKVLEDSLAVAGSEGLLPLPVFSDILAGVSADLSELDRAKIKANWCVVEDEMISYAESARQHYMGLYSAAANTSNRIDDFLNFYCDVYGHNDACFRDLIRGKLVNLFKTEFRAELLGKHLSVEDRRMVKETGLLGGEEKVRAVLGDLTKSDELLKKAVLPRRSQTDRRSHGSNAGTSGSSRSKSPDNRHNRKNYGKGQKRGPRGRSGGGGAKKPKLDQDSEDESSPPSKDKRKSSGNTRGKNNSKKGFLITPLDKGCSLGYVAHSDPGGQLPVWVTNKLSTILAPKMVKKLHKACINYNSWKNLHNPNHKPWLYPEQISSKRILISDCVKPSDMSSGDSTPDEDESTLSENDLSRQLDMISGE